MALYFHDSVEHVISTSLSPIEIKTRIERLFLESQASGSKLRFRYDGRIDGTGFYSTIKRSATLEATSKGSFFNNLIPELVGVITDSGVTTKVRLTVKNKTASSIFLWMFHVFGILLASVGTYLILTGQGTTLWPLVLGGCFFALAPVLTVNLGMVYYGRDFAEEINSYLSRD